MLRAGDEIMGTHDDNEHPNAKVARLEFELAAARAELLESRARLEVALDAGRLGLWRWDAAADSIDWHDHLCAMFGLEPAHAPRRRADWMAIVPPGYREQMDAQIDAALETGDYPDFELAVGVAPSKRWFVVRGFPTRTPEGRITGLMGGVLEVTGLRVLEEQMRQTQKLEALGQLSAGVAHNFNNMLAAIVPVIELAKLKTPSDADLFDLALQSARHAAELVKDLMLFARREADPKGVPEALDVVVRRAAELCGRTFGQQVRVAVRDLQAASGVFVDGARTEQVLLNLIVNARDAVENLPAPRRTVTLSAHEGAQGDFVEIRVADLGDGMDDAVRQRIFEPFFTTKPIGRGTGLGLPTAWGAVEAQGGHLSCESVPGVGTTFVLALPSRSLGTQPLCKPDTPAPPSSARVLIIDDEPHVLRSTIMLLELMGHQALGASSGEDGVRVARAEGVDVVLLDRSMPGQPPEATLAQLREIAADLPIIAFSGLADELEGATVQLGKPATWEQLEHAIGLALAARPPQP